MRDLNERLETLAITYPPRGFVSTAPAERWEDGLIVGNGVQGALCFSRPYDEEIVLSHESLFLPVYPRHEYIRLAPHLDRVRDFVLQGRGAEAMALTVDLARQQGYQTRELTDPFIGACSVRLVMPAGEPVAYARSVDFETGGSIVAWKDDTGLVHRRTFASRADGIVAVELKRLEGALPAVGLELARIERGLDEEYYAAVVAETVRTVEDDFLGFRVRLNRTSDDQRLLGYSVSMRVVAPGGETRVHDRRLMVEGADRILLLIDVRPDTADAPVNPAAVRARLASIAADYDVLLERHAEIHRPLFNRLSLKLCARAEEHRATEELRATSRVGSTDRALIQKAFDAGRYGIISSTGTLPPALQGIWTGTWRPNWSGDFTLNGNVQSAVAASLPGNHAECMRAALDYLSGLMDDFRTNARELFGFRGIYVPWRSSTHGQCHYAGVGREPDGSAAFPGMYWFAGTAWWARHFYEYWLYTGDEAFFAQQLAPYFLEAAAFYEDYLRVEDAGALVLVPSYSPENSPAGGHFLQPNATMTIAAIREFLRTLLVLADPLDVGAERRGTWRDLLGKLPGYAIDPSGALAEWSWPGTTNNEAHRHASHLYPLYHGLAPEIADSPAFREACRTAIEKRLEYRRRKHGAEMAFGLVQLGMAASNLRDTELARECVEWLVNAYWSPTMVSQHDPGEILNLDISGGLPAVVLNMLVQSAEPETPDRPWSVTLLPCLPDRWQDGSLAGVRCKGGFELSFAWVDGRVTTIELTSLRGGRCAVAFNGTHEEITLPPGETWRRPNTAT